MEHVLNIYGVCHSRLRTNKGSQPLSGLGWCTSQLQEAEGHPGSAVRCCELLGPVPRFRGPGCPIDLGDQTAMAYCQSLAMAGMNIQTLESKLWSFSAPPYCPHLPRKPINWFINVHQLSMAREETYLLFQLLEDPK